MSVISKELFYRKIGKNVHCSDLHFWTKDCRKAEILSPYFIGNMVRGTGKFFLPIYVLKLILNYKKVNDVEFLKSLVFAEATSIVYGIVLGSLFVATVCILRKISGRVHYYNLILFPGIVSGLSLLVESKENQILDTLIFFNSFVETMLNYIDSSIFKITKTGQTLMFMVISAFLMFLLENRRKELKMVYFWFYTPSRRKTNDESEDKEICEHTTCWKFWKEGFVKYFPLGYLVNVIRKTIPKLGTLAKKPKMSINLLFGVSNIKFGLFIGGYVAIYRIITCYLLKWGKIRRKYHSLIAGFLSALTYAISPNIQVVVVGITTILQILYAGISDRLNIKNNFWPRQLVYMVTHGILFHLKIFYPQICSPYYSNMINACTNNVIPAVYERLILKYFYEEIGRNHVFKYVTGT